MDTVKKWLSFLLLVFIGDFAANAQIASPITMRFEKQRISNDTIEIALHATIANGIQLFSTKPSEPDLPATTVIFDSSVLSRKILSLQEKGVSKTYLDSNFGKTIIYFTDSVIWKQQFLISRNDSLVIKGVINYFYKSGENYLPGETPIRVFIQKELVGEEKNSKTVAKAGQNNWMDLGWIFLTAFAGGLLALLTPCIFSMIPVTVGFFTKRSKTRQQGIRNALVYAASIIAIFTLIGFIITLVFGPAALNNLATNWVANLLFFALFMVFGISFLGAFDINLPSSWVNSTDSKAGTGSIWGIFFMALTLVLVSFSCTGPIIGPLLVVAANGSYFGPLVGMFGFSVALALPFALFAFFPTKLNVIGKAGGWLNAVKVTLGFIEIALALKFLSNADLVQGWRLLDREIFIVAWVVIFSTLGIYLLGAIRFKHDSALPANDFGLPALSVTRLMLAMTSFAFALYMVPGLWGAPLKAISAFVPPLGTQDFVVGSATSPVEHASSKASLPQPTKYYEKMKIYEPEVVKKFGLVTYFDYEEAKSVAKLLKKPLMLDFTGVNCANCRKMEGQVWSDKQVMERLKNNFVMVSLYVDVQNIELQESEQFYSEALKKQVETLGDLNTHLQVSRFGANSQPFYFFLDDNENRLLPNGYGYDSDIPKFIALLDTAVAKYNLSK